MKALPGSVFDISEAAAQRAHDIAVARQRHPAGRHRFNGTARALIVATQLITANDLPECRVAIADDGQVLVLDYSGRFHAAGDLRQAAQSLGWVVEELAADMPDGSAGIELRASDYRDGILRTVRAVVPVPAEWDVR